MQNRPRGRQKNEDKRRAVMVFLENPEQSVLSDREIARRCNVSKTFVSKLRIEAGLKATQRTHTTQTTPDTAKIAIPSSRTKKKRTRAKQEFIDPVERDYAPSPVRASEILKHLRPDPHSPTWTPEEEVDTLERILNGLNIALSSVGCYSPDDLRTVLSTENAKNTGLKDVAKESLERLVKVKFIFESVFRGRW